jgi:hypothetical protein
MLRFGRIQTRQVTQIVNAQRRVRNLKIVTWEYSQGSSGILRYKIFFRTEVLIKYDLLNDTQSFLSKKAAPPSLCEKWES